MDALRELGPVALYLSCFGLSIVSAIVPWVNAEAIVLTYGALTTTPGGLMAVAVAATAGQMIGKCVLYGVGRGATRIGSSGGARKVERWRSWLGTHRWQTLPIILLSAFIGIPPFYVVSILAGTLDISFAWFVSLGIAGRLLRFTLLAFAPQLIMRSL